MHAAYDPAAVTASGPRSCAPTGLRGLPLAVPRQVEPGALLLGQLRSRGDALLGPHGAAASGRRPEPPRLGDARGLLARGVERRLLARQRRAAPSRLLHRTPIPSRRASARRRSSRRGAVRSVARRVRAAVRGRAEAPDTGGTAARIRREHVRRGGERRRMGSRRARAARTPAGGVPGSARLSPVPTAARRPETPGTAAPAPADAAPTNTPPGSRSPAAASRAARAARAPVRNSSSIAQSGIAQMPSPPTTASRIASALFTRSRALTRTSSEAPSGPISATRSGVSK